MEEAPIREKLREQGYEAIGGSTLDFNTFLQQEERVGRTQMQEINLKVERVSGVRRIYSNEEK